MGSRKPSSAAAGSVVARPALSVAQVSGIASPRLSALRIFARATTLMAMSSKKGRPPGFGTPKPTGLLPRRASLPPHGAIVVVALLPMMLAKPASAAMSE
jgi:hypothetical protein